MANTRTVTIHVEEANISALPTEDIPCLINRASLPNEMCDPVGPNAARTDGGDIRAFVGGVAAPIEHFEFAHDSASNAADAICNIYVRVPAAQISATTGADVELQYGDGALTAPAATAALGRNNVWTGFAYVTHDFIVDATGGSADATQAGAISNARSPDNLFAVSTGSTNEGANTGVVNTNYSGDVWSANNTHFMFFQRTPTGLSQFGGQAGSWLFALESGAKLSFTAYYTTDGALFYKNNATQDQAWHSHIFVCEVQSLNAVKWYMDKSLQVWDVSNPAVTVADPVSSSGTTMKLLNRPSGSLSRAVQGVSSERWIYQGIASPGFIDLYHTMVSAPASFATAGAPAALGSGTSYNDSASLAVALASLASTQSTVAASASLSAALGVGPGASTAFNASAALSATLGVGPGASTAFNITGTFPVSPAATGAAGMIVDVGVTLPTSFNITAVSTPAFGAAATLGANLAMAALADADHAIAESMNVSPAVTSQVAANINASAALLFTAAIAGTSATAGTSVESAATLAFNIGVTSTAALAFEAAAALGASVQISSAAVNVIAAQAALDAAMALAESVIADIDATALLTVTADAAAITAADLSGAAQLGAAFAIAGAVAGTLSPSAARTITLTDQQGRAVTITAAARTVVSDE